MSESERLWFNFRTRQTDALYASPDTDEAAVQYIPQNAAAQGLYAVYRDQGKSVAEAMIAVLEASTKR